MVNLKISRAGRSAALVLTLLTTACYSPAAIRTHNRAAVQSCEADRRSGKLPTYTATARCVNAANAMYERRGNYQDIAAEIAAKRLKVAADADAGRMTGAQAEARFVEIGLAMEAAVKERADLTQRVFQERFRANWLGSGPPPEPVAVNADALARLSAGMLAPTQSGTFGESVQNGLYGAPPPPAHIYQAPTQTTCFRSGPNVICNSQ